MIFEARYNYTSMAFTEILVNDLLTHRNEQAGAVTTPSLSKIGQLAVTKPNSTGLSSTAATPSITRPVMTTFQSSKGDATAKNTGSATRAGVGGVASSLKTPTTKATRLTKPTTTTTTITTSTTTTTTSPSSGVSGKTPASHVLTMQQRFDAAKAAKPTPTTPTTSATAAAAPSASTAATAGIKNKVNPKR